MPFLSGLLQHLDANCTILRKMTILGSKKIVTFNPDVSIDENQRFPICHHGTQSNALFLVPSAEKGILNAKRIGRILRIHNGQGAILIHVTRKTRTLIPRLGNHHLCLFLQAVDGGHSEVERGYRWRTGINHCTPSLVIRHVVHSPYRSSSTRGRSGCCCWKNPRNSWGSPFSHTSEPG